MEKELNYLFFFQEKNYVRVRLIIRQLTLLLCITQRITSQVFVFFLYEKIDLKTENVKI